MGGLQRAYQFIHDAGAGPAGRSGARTGRLCV